MTTFASIYLRTLKAQNPDKDITVRDVTQLPEAVQRSLETTDAHKKSLLELKKRDSDAARKRLELLQAQIKNRK